MLKEKKKRRHEKLKEYEVFQGRKGGGQPHNGAEIHIKAYGKWPEPSEGKPLTYTPLEVEQLFPVPERELKAR